MPPFDQDIQILADVSKGVGAEAGNQFPAKINRTQGFALVVITQSFELFPDKGVIEGCIVGNEGRIGRNLYNFLGNFIEFRC